MYFAATSGEKRVYPFLVFILFASVLSQFTGLLLSEPVTGYLRSCSQAMPALVLSRAWLLRHEHHLLYLLLRLAHRLVGLSVTHPVLMMNFLRSRFTFLSNVYLYCEFRMIKSHQFQTFLCVPGSGRTTNSQARFIISPGGAGCVTMVITWQWIPGTWTDIHHCFQQRLYIVSSVFNVFSMVSEVFFFFYSYRIWLNQPLTPLDKNCIFSTIELRLIHSCICPPPGRDTAVGPRP